MARPGGGPASASLTALRWRDVDLASGKLRVADAKTEAPGPFRHPLRRKQPVRRQRLLGSEGAGPRIGGRSAWTHLRPLRAVPEHRGHRRLENTVVCARVWE